jgi:hypothetical protein
MVAGYRDFAALSLSPAALGPILLQKSPQTFCEIRIGNNRIDAGKYLNQCCASAPQLESILRGQIGKIFLQQYRDPQETSAGSRDYRCPIISRF